MEIVKLDVEGLRINDEFKREKFMSRPIAKKNI